MLLDFLVLFMDYPSLYKVADKASLTAQNYFLRLSITHALLLIISTVLAINVIPSKEYSIIMAIFFAVALGISIFLGVRKYEKTWYNGRAVAESIKTSTWRYSMRSSPFDDADKIQIPKSVFRNMLVGILKANKELGSEISSCDDTGEQITVKMNSVRSSKLNERKDFYLKNRVDEQRHWYALKAAYNKRMQKWWFASLVIAQFIAFLCVILRIAYPEWKYWPTDVFVVIAAFSISWIQLKKFNELSSSYSLTAQEIGVIKGLSEEITSEKEFSEFVNNAELAFSREHTHWIAKQTHG